MCQAHRRQYGFNAISLMPTNLYGPGDNFSHENSHVLPALIRRFHEAKLAGLPEVVVWGTGPPLREFLHVDDLAAAAVFLTEHYEGEDIVNVGTGEEISIADLAALVKRVIGFGGALRFDPTKPDGTPPANSSTSSAFTRSVGDTKFVSKTVLCQRIAGSSNTNAVRVDNGGPACPSPVRRVSARLPFSGTIGGVAAGGSEFNPNRLSLIENPTTDSLGAAACRDSQTRGIRPSNGRLCRKSFSANASLAYLNNKFCPKITKSS